MTHPEGYEMFKTKKLVNGQERKYRYKKINGKMVYQKYDKKDFNQYWEKIKKRLGKSGGYQKEK